MRGDPKVVEYLNKALRHELTAVNQYWLHYRLLDNWGYKTLAKAASPSGCDCRPPKIAYSFSTLPATGRSARSNRKL